MMHDHHLRAPSAVLDFDFDPNQSVGWYDDDDEFFLNWCENCGD